MNKGKLNLPNGWRRASLKEVAASEPQNGAFIKKPEFGSGTPFINVKDIYKDVIVDVLGVERLHCDETTSRRYAVKEDDLLFVRSSLKRAGIGACCVVKRLSEPAIFDCHLIRISPNKAVSDALYLGYYFLSERGREDLIARSKTTTMTTINQTSLIETDITLPPLAEQNAIARALRAVQEAKAARQKELALERERKAALMQHLFTYGTRGEARKQTDIGEMPESWGIVKLGEVARIVSGGTPERDTPEYWNGDISWVKTGEINYSTILKTEESITKEGLDNSSARVIQTGALLMAMYGQGVTRGRVAILGIDAAINQACAAILLPDDFSTEFLFFFLTFSYEKIRLLGHGANQKNLNSALIRSIIIPMPSLPEQKEIATLLTSNDKKLSALQRECEALDELFRAMLEEFMTGKLPVQPLLE